MLAIESYPFKCMASGHGVNGHFCRSCVELKEWRAVELGSDIDDGSIACNQRGHMDFVNVCQRVNLAQNHRI